MNNYNRDKSQNASLKLKDSVNPVLRAFWYKKYIYQKLSFAIIALTSTLFHQGALATAEKVQTQEGKINLTQETLAKGQIIKETNCENLFEQVSRDLSLLSYNNGRSLFHNDNCILNNVFNINCHMEANDKQYVVRIEIPGYDKKEMKIELQGDYLIVSAKQIQNIKEKKDPTSLNQEKTRSFYQKIFLPEDINKNSILSNLKNGVLTITLERIPIKKEDVKIIPIS